MTKKELRQIIKEEIELNSFELEAEDIYWDKLKVAFDNFLYDWKLNNNEEPEIVLNDVIDFLIKHRTEYGDITTNSLRTVKIDNKQARESISSPLLNFLLLDMPQQEREWTRRKSIGKAIEDALYYTGHMSNRNSRKFEEDYPFKQHGSKYMS